MRRIRKALESIAVALEASSVHAQMREVADLSAIPLEPPVERYTFANAFPDDTFRSPLASATPPGETNLLFVAERKGRIKALANLFTASSAGLFLEMTNRVQDDGRELRLKGLAFHPGYATNGIVFITCCRTYASVRLSRYTRSATNNLAADPDSELVFIEQARTDIFHNINHVVFGPDGYLYVEGTIPGPRSPPPGFAFTPPVWEYPHDLGPFGGSAVIGGFVVRVTNYPDLVGTYLCIDHLSGHVWSIERGPSGTNVTQIAGQDGIVQFGLDPARGDVLLVNHYLGILQRLVEETNAPPYPARLSDTGVFSDRATLAPAPGVEPYELILPFWSDYAIKRRWFAISNLTDGFGWRRDAPWTTPAGAVWVKHFDIEMDRFNSNTLRRIETRLLVRTVNGPYGVSDCWNNAQTESFLVPDTGDIVDLPITNFGIPAVPRWTSPSRADCMACHRADAGFVLGYNTCQLNHDGTLCGASGNQLSILDIAGYFTNAPENPLLLPRHMRPNETNYSLEIRARSYLGVNCGYCHQGTGVFSGSEWDGRAHIALDEAGMVRVPPIVNAGDSNNLLLAPGQPTNSVIRNRMAAEYGFSQMPPLASAMLEYEAIQRIADWITHQLPGWQSYADGRLAEFTSTNAPAGAPEADPDEDGVTNWEEYLANTDPNDGAGWWSGSIALGPGGVVIDADLFNRAVWVERYSDVLTWTPWAIAANIRMPLAAGQTLRLHAPPDATNTFFRFCIAAR